MSKGFHFFTELISGIQIVLSPLLISIVIGGIVYASNPSTSSLVIAIVIGLLGLAVGIIWAVSVSKKEGTSHFMSRTMASPELDEKGEKEKPLQ